MKFLALLIVLLAGTAWAEDPVRVAAAGSLRDVLPKLIEAFAARNPRPIIEARYGSSGQLAKQILRGAPDDLFLSADESFVDIVARQLSTGTPTAIYAEGRLALFRPKNSPVVAGATVETLDLDTVHRLAIAQPDNAPYGRVAREALIDAGHWQAVQSKLAVAENVAQAAQFAVSGNVDLALIAVSQAMALGDRGDWTEVSTDASTILRHKMLLLDRRAESFYLFLLGNEAYGLWRAHGFRAGD